MVAALSREIPITEYAPKKVKQSVTKAPKLLHAMDALAVAVCHHFQKGVAQTKSSKSWGAFVSENPGRVK